MRCPASPVRVPPGNLRPYLSTLENHVRKLRSLQACQACQEACVNADIDSSKVAIMACACVTCGLSKILSNAHAAAQALWMRLACPTRIVSAAARSLPTWH